MITVNFVDSVQKTFNGDSIVWVAGANIIDVIKELAEKYNLDPYSIANFRYVVNGKDIPQKKFAKNLTLVWHNCFSKTNHIY